MAHIGVGAFHRCHQEEYTDDLLGRRFDRWGVVGINIRDPKLGETLGRQEGLYTRLLREDDQVEARVIGSMVRVVDSQESASPALKVIASPEVDVVTMTVTEKGYCHVPAIGELAADSDDIAHDRANPTSPRSLPGLLVRALEMRMQTHARPLTLMSCDNIPANGAILANVVRAMAETRSAALARWIETNVAFPSSMVDRIAPATTRADIETVERDFGYRDDAVVVGEPFRQWVIEQSFAGRMPRWDLAGATFVDEVQPYEHLKMRVLNGAQTALSYLGVFAGHEHTCDDMADPLLAGFVRRMLLEETVPTLQPVPGISPKDYVEQSLKRLSNKAIRHRNHQIATDGSQKIVQRLLNPIRVRLSRGEDVSFLTAAVAGWMAYLIRASDRFGKSWTADDPYAGRVAAIADRIGNDPRELARAIVGLDGIFHPALAGNASFITGLAQGIEGFLEPDSLAYLRKVTANEARPRLNLAANRLDIV
jgi:fructuronate reductase